MNNKSNSLPNMYNVFSIIRDIIFIITILYITCPESNLYSWRFPAIILWCWLFFAILSETGYFLSIIFNKLPILLAWPAFSTILSLVGYTDFNLRHIFFYIELFIFGYYITKKNNRILTLAIVSYLIFNLIISFYSINILNSNPNIARELASGDVKYASSLSSPFTSDYFYIYAVMLLAISLIPIIRSFYEIKRFRLLVIFVFLLQVFLIAKSHYTIALLGVVLFSIINLIKIPKSKTLLMASFPAVIVISIFLFQYGYKLFDWFSLHSSSHLFKVRFTEISNILKNKEFIKGSDSQFRFSLYRKSFETFLSHPFIGVGDIGYTSDIIGHHSTIIDRLAKYGIVGGSIYFGTIITFYIYILKQIPIGYKRSYKYILIVLGIISLINKTIDPSIMLIVGFIIPALYIVCFKEKEKNIISISDYTNDKMKSYFAEKNA